MGGEARDLWETTHPVIREPIARSCARYGRAYVLPFVLSWLTTPLDLGGYAGRYAVSEYMAYRIA